MILPIEFTQNIERDYSPQNAQKILEVYENIEQHPVYHSIRLNHKKVTEIILGSNLELKTQLDSLLSKAEKIPWTENGYYLPQKPDYSCEPLYEMGIYYPQESSSMILEWFIRELQKPDQLLSHKNGLKVLDLCAAPGGKSLILADLLNLAIGDCLISNEVNPHRNRNLQDVVNKWETNNIIITRNKSTSFEKFDEFFDCILVDAPCSGEGMFRKSPETINEWSLKNIDINVRRQKEILHSAVCALAVDGALIYSTCTLNKEENEEIIAWLEESYNMEVVIFENLPTDKKHNFIQNKQGCYHLIHPFVQGEGLFISVLQKIAPLKLNYQKKQEENLIWTKLKGRKLNNNPKSTSWQREVPIIHYENNEQIIHAWQREYPKIAWDSFNLVRLDEISYILIPKTLKEMYQIINDNLTITRSPIELGTIYRRDIKTLKKI